MPKSDRDAAFDVNFLDDLRYWAKIDRKTLIHALDLVEAIMRNPFEGIGKPEPLKFRAHTWSRRLTQEHRLVYVVSEDRIEFLQAGYHY